MTERTRRDGPTRRDGLEIARVGVLGIGLMGSAMARRLLAQGISVTAWDRNPQKARALEAHGAQPARTSW